MTFNFCEFALIAAGKNNFSLFWREEYVRAFSEFIRCIYPGNLTLIRLASVSFALAALGAVYIIYRISEDKKLFWLLALALAVSSFFSYVMALGDKITIAYWPICGGHYFYSQNVIILLIMFAAATRGNFKNEAAAKVVVSVVLLASVCFGFESFRSSAILRQDVPSWPGEVGKWQADHGHKLEIWPKGWTMSL